MPTVSEGWDWGLSVHLRPTTFACSSIQLNLNLKRLGNSDTEIDIEHSPSASQALPLLQPPLNPVSTAEQSSPTPRLLCQPVSIYMQLSAKQLPYFFFPYWKSMRSFIQVSSRPLWTPTLIISQGSLPSQHKEEVICLILTTPSCSLLSRPQGGMAQLKLTSGRGAWPPLGAAHLSPTGPLMPPKKWGFSTLVWPLFTCKATLLPTGSQTEMTSFSMVPSYCGLPLPGTLR